MVNEASKIAQPQRTLPDPAFETLHLAPPVISTSPEPMIETSALSLALAATLPEPAIDTSAVRLASPPRVDIARSGDRHVDAVGLARGLDVARPGDGELDLASRDRAELEAARSGHLAFEIAGDLVDGDPARSGDRRSAKRRGVDGENCLAVAAS